MLKTLFVLEIFKFLSCYVENGLIRKLRLAPKSMISQTGEQIVKICILPNILGS